METKTIFEILSWLAVSANLVSYYLVSKKIVNGFGWTFQILVFLANFFFILVNGYRGTYSFVLMNAVYLIINFHTFYKLTKAQKGKPLIN
jgi:hypothetical protein